MIEIWANEMSIFIAFYWTKQEIYVECCWLRGKAYALKKKSKFVSRMIVLVVGWV